MSNKLAFGQKNRNGIGITVKDERNVPLQRVVIQLLPTTITVQTNENGVYQFNNLISGEYTLTFSRIGYQTNVVSATISQGEFLQISIHLQPSSQTLAEVKVVGDSPVSQLSRQGYNVTAIDASKLYNTTYDLNQALNKVSGVRIRESGGLGSTFNFSMNGFSGSQIKFFLDGIPMDNFGASLQTNNIPINLAERVEVYKGVVPVWLGGDALGGAINIVTNPNRRNYLDVSYSYGSFNTHKSSINAGYTLKSGFTFQVNAYQNSSDNDYWVNAEVANLVTGVYTNQRVRRFHDQYKNETVVINTGITGKRYATKLLVGLTVGQNKAAVQTGNRMFDVYGARSRNGTILMPSLKYLKNDLFIKGINLSINGSYNFGTEQTVDTAFKQYNWLGDFRNKSTDPDAVGGELSRTLYKFRNHSAQLSSLLSYKINEYHSVVINNTFVGFNRKGKDELDPENELNKQPRRNYKDIIGLGYRLDITSEFNGSFFLKNYSQRTIAFTSYTPPDAPYGTPSVYSEDHRSIKKVGYGTAISYFLTPPLQLKASYEKAYRLPDSDELFGNPTTDLLPNFILKPERSDNINIGINYRLPRMNKNLFALESNFIYRNAKDFIRPSLISSRGVAMVQMLNQQDVVTYGIDATLRYTYEDALTMNANLTWQDIRNQTKYVTNTSLLSETYKDRIPNLPYLFANFAVQYRLRELGSVTSNLSLGYNLTYVHAYFLNWPSQGQTGSKPIIPGQIQHDINALHTLKNGRYSIGLECRNILGAPIYDSFSLQKPGRAYYLKFRYFVSGKP